MPFIPNTQIAAAGAIALLEEQIAEGGGLASFDFQNISGAYRHLMVKLIARGDTGATFIQCDIRFNNDSGTNYHRESAAALGSNMVVSQGQAQTAGWGPEIPSGNSPASYFGIASIDIPYYSQANVFKGSYTSEIHARSAAVGNTLIASWNTLWLSTSEISRVTIFPESGTLVQFSRASLYGLT